jgi:AraC-like DNA-binding protein
VSYVERVISSPAVLCTWEQVSPSGVEQLVVPDACVDLIWSGRRLSIAGPDTGPRAAILAPGSRLVGVRLRPGAAGAVFGVPASEVRDLSVDAAELLGRAAAAALSEALAGPADPHELLVRALERPGVSGIDPLVTAAVIALGRPRARVDKVADELGISARQLQRRITDAVGYGPKMLQRVRRLRRLQALPAAPLVELALDAGYADQAHMTADVTCLTGIPPVRFLKDRTLAAA